MRRFHIAERRLLETFIALRRFPTERLPMPSPSSSPARPALKRGDRVSWNTSQGVTTGKVTKKVTGTAKAGGHTAKASKAQPEYEVQSEKSGKKAIHKAEALHKPK